MTVAAVTARANSTAINGTLVDIYGWEVTDQNGPVENMPYNWYCGAFVGSDGSTQYTMPHSLSFKM